MSENYESVYSGILEKIKHPNINWCLPVKTRNLLKKISTDSMNEHRAERIMTALFYNKKAAIVKWTGYTTKIAKDHCAKSGLNYRVHYPPDVRERAAEELEKAFRIKVMQHLLDMD